MVFYRSNRKATDTSHFTDEDTEAHSLMASTVAQLPSGEA